MRPLCITCGVAESVRAQKCDACYSKARRRLTDDVFTRNRKRSKARLAASLEKKQRHEDLRRKLAYELNVLACARL
jgi:hypothetical protein